jgi:hypothetical protein
MLDFDTRSSRRVLTKRREEPRVLPPFFYETLFGLSRHRGAEPLEAAGKWYGASGGSVYQVKGTLPRRGGSRVARAYGVKVLKPGGNSNERD